MEPEFRKDKYIITQTQEELWLTHHHTAQQTIHCLNSAIPEESKVSVNSCSISQALPKKKTGPKTETIWEYWNSTYYKHSNSAVNYLIAS